MSCDPETTISSADIANVKADFELFDNVAESVEDTTTTPGGKTIDTLQGRLKKLGWQTPPVAYTSGISFTISDGTKIINRSGINYAPVPSELPFTTTGTWGGADEDKFYQISISADSIGGLSGFTFSTVTSMSTKTTVGGDVVAPVLGQKFSTLGRSAANDGGGADYVVTNDAANTYDKIDLGGGLTAALIIGSVLNARVFGLSTSATPAANKLVMDALISQAFATGQTIYIPLGYYECEPFTIVPVGTQRTIHIKGEFSCRSGEIIPTSADSIKQAASVLYFPNATGTATAIEYGVSGGTGELHGPILEDLYILGPAQEAGANPTNNNTGLRITDGCRDMILRNVMISQWRAGLITFA